MEKKMKKGLLIFPILKDVGKADGIVAKNEGIQHAFIENGVDVDVLEFYSHGIYNKGKVVYAFHKNKYLRIFQYHLLSWKKIVSYVIQEQYDFIWFRTPLILSPVANFISSLKEQDPRCKIILEYGYYPFINELSKSKKLLYKLNRGNELKAHRNADYAVTYSGIKMVDNLVNIPINNGIDLSSLPVVNIKTDVRKQVNMICVSSMKRWHAYERLVEGLGAYIKQNDFTPFHLNIVGEGPEKQKIREMVTNLDLDSHVTFHDFKIGKDLDQVYNDNHVAIGTLGLHRLGITFSSSLKNREYFGRGLPMVLSTPDEDMPADLPYVLYIPEGEGAVDINSVFSFAQSIYDRKGINHEIRDYAEQKVSWKSKIKTVLSYLENNNANRAS